MRMTDDRMRLALWREGVSQRLETSPAPLFDGLRALSAGHGGKTRRGGEKQINPINCFPLIFHVPYFLFSAFVPFFFLRSLFYVPPRFPHRQPQPGEASRRPGRGGGVARHAGTCRYWRGSGVLTAAAQGRGKKVIWTARRTANASDTRRP